MRICKLIYIFLQKINWFLKIIKKISSMIKYIQFCVFNIKRYILLYDYEFYYRLESQQSQQKLRKYFWYFSQSIFCKNISLLLLRKKQNDISCNNAYIYYDFTGFQLFHSYYWEYMSYLHLFMCQLTVCKMNHFINLCTFVAVKIFLLQQHNISF